VRQIVPLQSMEVHSEADIHLQPMEDCDPEGSCDPVGSPTLKQAPAKTCRPVERGAHTGAGLLAGLVTLWGPMLEQPVPEGLHPVGRTHAGAVELAACGKHSHWRSLWRTVSRERDLTLEQGKSVRSPPPDGQGVAENPIPQPNTAFCCQAVKCARCTHCRVLLGHTMPHSRAEGPWDPF